MKQIRSIMVSSTLPTYGFNTFRSSKQENRNIQSAEKSDIIFIGGSTFIVADMLYNILS